MNNATTMTFEPIEATEGSNQILIDGPTHRGTFFIKDGRNNVWDGESWRGFGCPLDYTKFRDAVKDVDRARLAQSK